MPTNAPAGYSGTPLPKKLGIKEGSRVLLIGAPAAFARTLGALPNGAKLKKSGSAACDVVLLFVTSCVALDQKLPGAIGRMADGARLWIAWPKQASGVATDLKEDAVRARGLAAGLVDYKVCAIDATWSGLCFARRAVRTTKD